MQVWCNDCNKYTSHIQVSSKLDTKNGWKVGIKSQGGCRDSAADYRTTQCEECKSITTLDFATD